MSFSDPIRKKESKFSIITLTSQKKRVCDWENSELLEWLEEYNLCGYGPLLRGNDITNGSILREMDAFDLVILGIPEEDQYSFLSLISDARKGVHLSSLTYDPVTLDQDIFFKNTHHFSSLMILKSISYKSNEDKSSRERPVSRNGSEFRLRRKLSSLFVQSSTKNYFDAKSPEVKMPWCPEDYPFKKQLCESPYSLCESPHSSCESPHSSCESPHSSSCESPHSSSCESPHSSCESPHSSCESPSYPSRVGLNHSPWPTRPLNFKNPYYWTEEEVARWLQMSLSHESTKCVRKIVKCFKKNAIDGAALFELSESDLKILALTDKLIYTLQMKLGQAGSWVSKRKPERINMKVKLIALADEFDFGFIEMTKNESLSSVMVKIRLRTQQQGRVKYYDSDGDFITMTNQDNVEDIFVLSKTRIVVLHFCAVCPLPRQESGIL